MERYCIKCGKLATKKNDNCYVCESGHENWINPAPGSMVFVIKDDRVLYGVRSNNPGKGKLGLPGGFVDATERAEEAAVREAKEEMGIEIDIVDLLGTYTTSDNGRPILDITFIATTPSTNVVAGDDMSAGDPVWRAIGNLPGPDELSAEWLLQAQEDLLAWWYRHKG